jgi:hypothetical protein
MIHSLHPMQGVKLFDTDAFSGRDTTLGARHPVHCRKLKIGKATYLPVLHDDLHLEKFNCYYVPHSLEADQSGRGSNFPESLSRYSNKINNMSLNTY